MSDLGKTHPLPPDLNDFQRATVEAFAAMTPEQRRAALNMPRRTRPIPPGGDPR